MKGCGGGYKIRKHSILQLEVIIFDARFLLSSIMDAKVLLLLHLTLLVSYLHGSQAQAPPSRNITKFANITAGAGPNPSYWLSPSEDFAFGFFPLSNGKYLIGIWFDKTKEKTLVWSPSRDRPAETGSSIKLTFGGQLTATYSDGGSLLISNNMNADSGLMQDDGNLVLRDSQSSVVWQSFTSRPTDTILPGQDLIGGQELISNSNGSVDYSTGRFKLAMQLDGHLVLSTYNFSDPGYWVAGTQKPNARLIFNDSGLIYLRNSTATIQTLNMNINVSAMLTENYYQRATVDDQGNFQQYVYKKVNGSQWDVVWRAITEPCKVTAICGVYGYCTSPDNRTAHCQCLPGTAPLDPHHLSKGCYRNFIPDQYCGQKSPGANFQVEVINDTDIYNEDTSANLGSFSPADLENCTKAVVDDCYCMAATLVNSTCYKKRVPLLNARKSNPVTNGMKTLIKVRKEPNGSENGDNTKKKSSASIILLIFLLLSVTLASLSAVVFIYCYYVVRRYRRMRSSMNASVMEINLREFTFQEVHEATNGFRKKLGQGTFGTVYQGTLSLADRKTEIAVKQLERVIEQGEQEFVTELSVIGRSHHKNLVRLVGFCNQDSNRILVYELMKHGALSDLLFSKGARPSWDIRVEIALGIARGLLYLHEECENQIIHCDIKPQNVLLDDNYTAKIADFGLAKLLINNQTWTNTNVRGTIGYIAPEWLRHVPVTTKVDIFSFGVMLLEIICCRRHIDLNRVEEETEEDDLLLIEWVICCFRRGKFDTMVNYDEDVLSDLKRFERMAMVGLWCVHPEPIFRPSIKKVTQMLEGMIEVGVPPLLNESL